MDHTIASKVRSCAGTCKTLWAHFPQYWKNYSHHNGQCYGLSPQSQHGVVNVGGKFSIGDSGEVRARRKHVIGDETGEAIDYSKPMSGWLVATTLPSVDARKVSQLCIALGEVMRGIPELKAVINLNDGTIEGVPRIDKKGRSSAEDVTINSRITTTWIPAPKARFWRSVLSPTSQLMQGECSSVPLTLPQWGSCGIQEN